VNDLLDFGRWYEASSVSASVHVRERFRAFKGQHDRLGVHQSFCAILFDVSEVQLKKRLPWCRRTCRL
jgi:hypothetical protein